MTRRSFWTRAKHRVGLERPHFWEPLAAQKNREVAPARHARHVILFCPRPLTANVFLIFGALQS